VSSKYSRTRNRGERSGGGGGLLLLAVIAVATVAIGYFGYSYVQGRNARATDAETGCLTNAPTPQAVLFMVDATDRLSRENAARIQSRIVDAVQALPRYSRVTIVPFGGDTAAPLTPIFNKCLPGNAATANLDEGGQLLEEQYQAFRQALDRMVANLVQLPDSRTSPITEQVIRAASDPQLHWQAGARTLVLVTDGLESSIYWTRNLRLPEPPDGLLQDVSAEYFEIGNPRGSRLQTHSMRLEWKSWFERAGAQIRVTAPGFAASP
jgi:hypothetical protein